MSNIDYDYVDSFLSNFTKETIPIRFIDYIHITYKDGTDKTIEGERIRKMFPNQSTTKYGIIHHQNDIETMKVHIDKNLVYIYLLEIEKAMQFAIIDGCRKYRKKAD